MKTNLVSRQELDTQQSLVVESAGTVKADEPPSPAPSCSSTGPASPAPIDGRVGLKQVDIGNPEISSGDTTGIVVLTQTHPIDVVFTLPENSIATVAGGRGKALSVGSPRDRTNKQKISVGELLVSTTRSMPPPGHQAEGALQ